MYLTHTPSIAKHLVQEFVWSIPEAGRCVHLTFDDGPIPEVTPWVLDTLAEFDAKATFFCVGRNAHAHPGLLARMREEGHAIGNHTYDHVNGWQSSTFAYLRNVMRCQEITGSRLFRPPYGRISPQQAKALCRRFTVVMWDVLSADFDAGLDADRCIRNVLDHSGPGSIIVFHDSLKAEPRLRGSLRGVLEHFVRENYSMKALVPGPFTPPTW